MAVATVLVVLKPR